jgi:hypothetical protein
LCRAWSGLHPTTMTTAIVTVAVRSPAAASGCVVGCSPRRCQHPFITIRIAMYQRLIAAGKEHKVALVACARKLVIFANTVVARGTPWQPQGAL